MSRKILDEDGVTDIEVFTTDELAAKVAEATAAAEDTWKPKVTDLEGKLTDAQKRAAERNVEMGQFRKLNEDQKNKLSEVERTLYDNMELLQGEREKNAGADKKAYDAAVASAIRGIVGKNDALFQKTLDMYGVIGLEDLTPEQVATKAKAAFYALGGAQPDLLASAGFRTDGAFAPPEVKQETKGNPDVDENRVKQGARELGVQIELTEEQKKARGIA